MTPTARRGVKGGLRHAVALAGRIEGLAAAAADGPRVLCYHGVCDDPPDEWSVTPAQLRGHLKLLRAYGQPVALGAIVDWLAGQGKPGLPPRAVAVTFDDGFADVLTHAAPLLAEAGVPGAAFVLPALLSRGAAAAHPSFAVTRPLLDWGQLRELRDAGWTIGAHSLTHPVLAALPEDDARRELRDARAALEQRLGDAVDLLAYPYGTAHTVSPRDQRLAAQAGYRAAFLDMTGPISPGADALALPRSKVLGSDSNFVVRSSLRGEMDRWRLIESRG